MVGLLSGDPLLPPASIRRCSVISTPPESASGPGTSGVQLRQVGALGRLSPGSLDRFYLIQTGCGP